MDILPCVQRYGTFVKSSLTEIKLTHKTAPFTYEPRYSNPYQYQKWFESRMKEVLEEARRKQASVIKCSIDDVPTYAVKTPLQKAVQLLKRHRDVYFQEDNDNAPISIIITTLAALAYHNERDVYAALCSIVRDMPKFIELRNRQYWIANPVMADENFADKWNETTAKKRAFDQWLSKVRLDLIENPLHCFGIHQYSKIFSKNRGKAPVDRAVAAMGKEAKTASDTGNLAMKAGTGMLVDRSTSSGLMEVKPHSFYGE